MVMHHKNILTRNVFYFLIYLCLFTCSSNRAVAAVNPAAVCTNPAALTLTLTGNYTVQKDSPTGVISGWVNIKSSDHWLNCNSSDGGMIMIDALVNSLGGANTIYYNGMAFPVFPTNIAGIGYIVKSRGVVIDAQMNWDSGWGEFIVAPTGISYTALTSDWGNSSRQWYGAVEAQVALVKYAESGSGSLSGSYSLQSVFVQDGDVTAVGSDDASVGLINVVLSGSVTTLKCDINAPAIRLDIGNIEVSTFKGRGTLSRESSPSKVGLNCEKGTNINIVLTGTTDPDSVSDDTVLALTPGANSAKGIGVQILYNNAPLSLNKTMNIMEATGGAVEINFSARYIQTQEQVVAGVGNATAVLNITFQ